MADIVRDADLGVRDVGDGGNTPGLEAEVTGRLVGRATMITDEPETLEKLKADLAEMQRCQENITAGRIVYPKLTAAIAMLRKRIERMENKDAST